MNDHFAPRAVGPEGQFTTDPKDLARVVIEWRVATPPATPRVYFRRPKGSQ